MPDFDPGPPAEFEALFEVPHPSSRDMHVLRDSCRAAVTSLRDIVTKDPDGDATRPNTLIWIAPSTEATSDG